MNVAVNELAIAVFKKPLSECSVADLKQLAHQYPWFGPAQLLYAKKLQAGSQTLYEDQVQKTSLYFQNRLWLHYLLNENESAETIIPPPYHEEKKELSAFVEKTEPTASPNIDLSEIVAEPTEETERIVDIAAAEPVVETAIYEATVISTPVSRPEEEEIIAAPSEEAGPVIEVPDEVSEVESATESFIELPPIKFQPINTMNAPLTFEPYHTIDYFASQGIKVLEDDKPKERFDQQLKSFTEWLKAMKRVTPSEIAASVVDPGGEKKVVQLAEHSLAERHIVTEAMAEVWIKQGNIARAEEIYRKLSLLDPLKTAYFAAKIEDLKKTS